MKSDISVVKVGLTVILAFVLIYLALAWIQRIHLFAPEENQYQIEFSSVNGLLTGDPVKVRGVVVGRVESIQPFADKVLVYVTVDQSMPLKQDAVATLQLKELMGGKQIDLYPGMSATALSPGSLIAGSASTDFSNAFGTVDQLLNQFDPNQAQQMVGAGDSIVSWMAEMLSHMDPEAPGRILSQLGQSSEEMARLARISRDTDWEGQINSRNKQLDSLIQATQAVLQETKTLLNRVDNQLLEPATSFFQGAQELTPKVESLVLRADSISQLLQTPDGFAQRMLADPSFTASVDTTLLELTRVLRQINQEKIIVGLRRKNK